MNIKNANTRFLESSTLSIEDLMKLYNTTYNGINDEKIISTNRTKYGRNEFSPPKRTPIFVRIIKALLDPFVVILLILATVSLIIDVIIPKGTNKDFSTVIIILAMVAISVFLKVYQEAKSQRAVSSLTQMIDITTAIKRNGITKERPLEDVVVGDIIMLAAGDLIPSDSRIIFAKDLFISESSLTGESHHVEKFINATDPNSTLLDRDNLAFMGTNVISGAGIALSIVVGEDTIFGDISKTVTKKEEKTSFEKGISSVSWLLIRFMIVMVPFVLLINGFLKNDWLGSILFALSIAVGLTPEMLPMIVTTSLSKGAVTMSKKEVIFKELSGIQNMGAMDILCTDKTGTLTKNIIVVENHHNLQGKSDIRVLRHAFLNSYYQTGLRNLIDNSIIDKTDSLKSIEPTLQNLEENFIKIDEIPFDFKRKRMSVVIQDKLDKVQLITKGAVEEMLSISSFVEYDGKVVPLTNELKKMVTAQVNTLNDKGMRVIAVSQKTSQSLNKTCTVEDESDMVLIGYLSFLDPIKESSEEAIKSLEKLGINVKVLTGDNERVTTEIARRLNIDTSYVLLGSQMDKMTDEEIENIVMKTHIFAKLAPNQKARLVMIMKNMGHVVGFLGDGINDAPAMKVADVGISVHDAVDIAKETAPVILLRKDLNVLYDSVVESRTVYLNMLKYIKITASSNFGNMFSVLIASIFLPFLPMLPLHILILNLVYDISCLTIPWDNVDKEQIKAPLPWETKSIRKFMLWFGPISSILDVVTFGVLFWYLLPKEFGGTAFSVLNVGQQAQFIMMFHAGWFVLSMISQTLIIHLIRSEKTPFLKTSASWSLMLSGLIGSALIIALPYTSIGTKMNLMKVPFEFYYWLIGITVVYILLTSVIKKIFIKRYKKLI